MSKIKISIVVFIVAFLALGTYSTVQVNANKRERNVRYYKLGDAQMVLEKGVQGSFDSKRTHTLSVAEMNKDGYRFWGYYHGYDGKNIRNDMGLAYSNDLINWVKEGDKPIVPNMRWGSVVVVDGIVNLFGTRNYGNNSYLVRMTSEDGKNFKNEQKIVGPVEGEKFQNGFIFYDENDGMYRFYYYHNKDGIYYIEEKHSKDISQLADATPEKLLSDSQYILAAPSMMYRDGRYWLAAETLHQVDGKKVWKTIVFSSKYPTKGFTPVANHEILVNSDACYFHYIFDNKLAGFYSHEYADGTWEMYLRTFDFVNKTTLKTSIPKNKLKVGEKVDISATATKYGYDKDVKELCIYACSDNSVVNLKNGTITALKPGRAVVTISHGGVSENKEIIVE